jgi:hypothetical protein
VCLLLALDNGCRCFLLCGRGIWGRRGELSGARILEEVRLEYATGGVCVWTSFDS